MHDNDRNPMDDSTHESPDEFLHNVVQRLREPVTVSPGFDDWIMAEVRAAAGPQHEATRARSWFNRHAEWWAAGALLVTVAVIVTVLRQVNPALPTALPAAPRTVQTVSIPQPAAVRTPTIEFTFAAPHAHSVTVAGTFNGWDTHATPLQRTASGTWRVNIPLGAGRYTYMFVVDGQRWMLDPSAARDAADDFGTANSVVMVAGQRET